MFRNFVLDYTRLRCGSNRKRPGGVETLCEAIGHLRLGFSFPKNHTSMSNKCILTESEHGSVLLSMVALGLGASYSNVVADRRLILAYKLVYLFVLREDPEGAKMLLNDVEHEDTEWLKQVISRMNNVFLKYALQIGGIS